MVIASHTDHTEKQLVKCECRLCCAESASIGEKNGYRIFRCPNCSFLFAELGSEKFDPRVEYDGYGANENYLSKKEKKLKRSGKRINRCKALVQGNLFLEIGCNVGIATEAARRLGFDAVGIDVDAAAIDIAKAEFPECRFYAELSTDFAARGERYDVIYCSEVMEHVPDPMSVLRSMKELLAENGIIWMSTPDAGHWRTPKNVLEWKELAPPDHIGMFSPKSLAIALRQSGLKIIKQEFNLKWGLKALIGHI